MPTFDDRPAPRPETLRKLSIATAIVALLALLQHSPIAPLPHRVDGFLLGFAIGLLIICTIAWAMLRKSAKLPEASGRDAGSLTRT